MTKTKTNMNANASTIRRTRARIGGLIAGLMIAVGLVAPNVAQPASAINVDTDRPRISLQELDFGRNWALGAPINGGFLYWDLTGGIITPDLEGNLYINNASGTCARMQLEYYDIGHNQLAVRNGGRKCATDGSLHNFSINLSPYGHQDITHVHVVLQVQNANGTYSDSGSQGWFLN